MKRLWNCIITRSKNNEGFDEFLEILESVNKYECQVHDSTRCRKKISNGTEETLAICQFYRGFKEQLSIEFHSEWTEFIFSSSNVPPLLNRREWRAKEVRYAWIVWI